MTTTYNVTVNGLKIGDLRAKSYPVVLHSVLMMPANVTVAGILCLGERGCTFSVKDVILHAMGKYS